VEEPYGVEGPSDPWASSANPSPSARRPALQPAPRKKRRPAGCLAATIIAVLVLFVGCVAGKSSSGSSSTSAGVPALVSKGPTKAQIAAAVDMSAREMALLVKTPDKYIGKTMVVHAKVTQFDAATGACKFRASMSHTRMESEYDYEYNSYFTGGDGDSVCPELSGIVAGDLVRLTVTSTGSYSYDTQIGGNTTAPSFQVEAVKAE
jgi:hypothetical protein